MQRGVIKNALVARVMRLPGPAQRLKAKDMPCVNRVRISEPRLDCGHAQPARTRRERWPRGGTVHGRDLNRGAVQTRPGKPRIFRLQGFQLASPGGESLQARNPTAGPGQAAVHLLGAREEGAGREGGERGEVSGGEADAALLR